MYFSTFIVKPCEVGLIPVFSLGAFWVVGEIIERGLGWNDAGRFKQSLRAPTQSNPHTQSHMHAHTLKHSHTHYLCRRKNILNICITKQYKGLSVVKYLFCQIKTWRRIHVGCHFLMSYVCKTLSPFAFNKISFSFIKNIPTVEWDLRHWIISLYTKKVFFPSLKFVQQIEAKSGELLDLDAIKGSGPTGQWGALNLLAIRPQVSPGFSPSQQSSCLAL